MQWLQLRRCCWGHERVRNAEQSHQSNHTAIVGWDSYNIILILLQLGPTSTLRISRGPSARSIEIRLSSWGYGGDNNSEIRILNKVVRMTDTGIELEVDPRHAELCPTGISARIKDRREDYGDNGCASEAIHFGQNGRRGQC